jgi:hypothetical protein
MTAGHPVDCVDDGKGEVTHEDPRSTANLTPKAYSWSATNC